jgi:UMF1 family MFS transporter
MTPPKILPDQPRLIRAWTMYDWANSVYNLVITTTFFPIYFLGITKSAYGEDSVPFLGFVFKNSPLYQWTLSSAYLSIALILPILSSIADARGSKKRFMQLFCYIGGAGCLGLFWFRGEQPNVEWGLFCFILATIGYCGSLVFYNSYLPEIASLENQDRVSARGFSMGYFGSVIAQMIGFALVVYFSAKGDNTSGPLYTFLFVGVWWIGFAQFTFLRLPSPPKRAKEKGHNMWVDGFTELRKVWNKLKQLPKLRSYLASFWFYSMGVQTVMLAATMFGQKTLGLPSDKLIITIVLIQLVAIAGAFLMSRLSKSFGNLKVLMGVVLFWVVICVASYEVANLKERGYDVAFHFYGLAVAVGTVMGGIQALSRSTYSKLMPETKDTASFFSFYDITEKTAIVIGTFTFALIDDRLGMKNSVLSLILFFVFGFIGLVLTNRIKTEEIPSRT